MTREQAEKEIRDNFTEVWANGIIKALEQEPILDKIRAEIVDLGQRTMNDNRASGIWACRDIIDKYKTGSKDEE